MLRVPATTITVSKEDQALLSAVPTDSLYGKSGVFHKYSAEKQKSVRIVFNSLQSKGRSKTTFDYVLGILREVFPNVIFVDFASDAHKSERHNGKAGQAANGRIIRGMNSFGG